MIIKKSSDMTSTEHYRILTGTVIPRPIFLVNTRSTEGVLNLAPYSYCGLVSSNPPILSVSVLRKRDGSIKDTTRNLLETKEAVLHLADVSNIEEMNMTSAKLPFNESELSLTNFTVTDSAVVSVPAINEAKIRLETTLYQHLEVGNLDFFLLEVVGYALDENVYTDEGKINIPELQVISKLYGKDYATIGEIRPISNKNKDH